MDKDAKTRLIDLLKGADKRVFEDLIMEKQFELYKYEILEVAIKADRPDFVKIAMEKDDKVEFDHMTMTENLDIINILLDHIDVNMRNEYKQTLLMLSKSLEMSKLLVSKGINVQKHDTLGRNALYYAVCMNKNSIKFLIEQKLTNVDKKKNNAYHLAAERNDPDVIDMLKETDQKINESNSKNETPLFVAVKNNSVEAVKKFLEIGAKTDIASFWVKKPLYEAVQNNNKEITDLLIAAGANYEFSDQNGLTLLHLAVKNENVQMIRKFLELGIDVNEMTRMSVTPLMLACKTGNEEIVRILLDKGAYVSPSDDFRRTAMSRAIESGNLNVCLMLIATGEEVNPRRKKDYLELAITSGFTEIEKLFL